MLINYTLGMIITVLLWIGLIVASVKFLLPRLKKLPRKIAFLLCLAISSLPVVPLLEVVLFPVYIIQADGAIGKSLLIGSSEYDFGNGKKADVHFEYPFSTIINCTNNDYVLETIIYGPVSEDLKPEIKTIPAHSAANIKSRVNYFPDETPPDELEMDSRDIPKKGWLRLAKETDY